MGGDDDEQQYIFYQLCDNEKLIGNVDRIELSSSEMSRKDVGNLRDKILQREQLTCRPRDLSLYPKSTSIDDCKKQPPLRISLPLSDDEIQGSSEEKPLLVVLSPLELPTRTEHDQQQVSSTFRSLCSLMH